MSQKKLIKDYSIGTSLLDFKQQLSISNLLSILQEMSSLHAEVLGLGYEKNENKNEFWVFSQQALQIYKIPAWQDLLTIETSVCDVSSLTAIREFSLSINSEIIGKAAMQCMLLDKNSHRPKRLKGLADSLYERESQHPDIRPSKIKIPDQLTQKANHIVKLSDLDLNQHVNNTKYAQWMLDTLPLDFHIKHTLQHYNVNFLAETFLGDNVIISSDYTEQLEKHTDPSKPILITFSGQQGENDKYLFSAQFYFVNTEYYN